MADDDATDDLKEDNADDETEAGVDESNGVDSDAGGSPVLVLASRLQTGQKVLHDVSQASTHFAWNSVNKVKTLLTKYKNLHTISLYQLSHSNSRINRAWNETSKTS